MAEYVNDTYYTDTYLAGRTAVIDTASFAFYARQASNEIKRYTFDRVVETTIPDEVKECTCELAEYLYRVDKEVKTRVKSEKVGEYSVTYENTSRNERNNTIREIIYRHLAQTELMYLGVM